MSEMNGIASIAAERQRQIDEEGWTPDHDDQHDDQSLALVAALYASPEPLFGMEADDDGKFIQFEDPWPSSWDGDWDGRERHDYRRRLVIAGALIAAEIDRIDRTRRNK